MTTPIPPVGPIPTSVVPPYVFPWEPTTNITPFTYRDGLTYLQRYERLVKYINRVIVPYVNENFESLGDAFETEVNLLIEAINAAIDELINADIGLNDALMAEIFQLDNSLTRAVTDVLYASKSAFDQLKAIVDDLDAVYVTKAEFDLLENAVTVLDGDVNTLETLVTTGRLSQSALDARYGASGTQALAVQRRGRYDIDSRFAYFRAGVVNQAQDTRVVLLGDSNATGGDAPYKSEGQGFPQRLADTSGSPTGLIGLGLANVPQTPNGMRWWSGAVGGLSSADYFTADRRTYVSNVKPHYVFHVIGSNDYAQQIPVATFKTNVTNACNQIETDNPGAINIIVTQQGRTDNLNRTIKQQAYRDALAEIVAANTQRRILIDVWDGFDLLDTGRVNNRFGIVSASGIHMAATGNAYMYEVISGYLGLPTPRLIAPYLDVREFSFVPTQTVNANTVIATMDVEAVDYPRLAEISGTGLFTPSAGNGTSELNTRMIELGGPLIEANVFRMGEAAQKSRPIIGNFIVHAREARTFDIQVGIGTGTVIITNTATALTAHLKLSPI